MGRVTDKTGYHHPVCNDFRTSSFSKVKYPIFAVVNSIAKSGVALSTSELDAIRLEQWVLGWAHSFFPRSFLAMVLLAVAGLLECP